jgi:hypothetical protein
MHGNSIALQRRCSERPKTAAAERLGAPFGRLGGGEGAERRARRLSGVAQRRPLQPRAAASMTTGFRAEPRPRALHADESQDVR